MKKICVQSSYSYIKNFVNYGSLFQYFALQTYLGKKGHYAYWLNVDWIKVSKEKRMKRLQDAKLHPQASMRLEQVRKSFHTFIKEYLNTSPMYYPHYKLLKYLPPYANMYVVGSDQVWAGYSDLNFLKFAPSKAPRIAYAASFGKDYIDENYRSRASIELKGFTKISVREKSGVDICQTMGCKAEHLIDPTLLLSADEYPMDKGTNIIKRNVLCYFLNNADRNTIYWEKIQEYALSINANTQIIGVENTYVSYDLTDIAFYTPEEWLTAYRNAEAIFTNTFHGTVFAILFQRPFLTILQNKPYAEQNTRVYSLLEMFGLQDRIYDPNKNIGIQMSQKIDWESVTERLSRERKKVENFWNDLL